ncbi:hypothetical protein GMSM_45470 [Geomonas sp. Red276]
MLTHLPVDISFVNERDEVLYYSQTKERKWFARWRLGRRGLLGQQGRVVDL